MRPFGVIELKGAGQSFQNAFGHPAEVPALKPGVVGDAYSGEDRDLLPAQPGHTPGAVLDAAVRGDKAREEAVAMFRAIWLFMDSVRASLDQLADRRLEERGVADLEDEEMEELMASLHRWASSGPSALEDDN